MKEKMKAPLFEKLLHHSKAETVSLHVPGHKMGQGFNPIGKEVYKDILTIDMTEIADLDDLHQPEGIILEAEERAAKLFQADHTFFLVNGSTSGNLAMILSVCQPGDKIIVQRNVHKSVIHGMMLAKVQPIYLNPEWIPELGITGSITLSQLIDSLQKHPDVKAVFLMNPNYYGIGIDLTQMIDLVHQYHIPVLIDEAHGAHFGFHPAFPLSSIQMGADMVVQSTHKTLSAMTMGSMLHLKSGFVDLERVKTFLSMIQTSSPSYPIMASLDLTRHWIETEGETLWENALQVVDLLHRKTADLQVMRLKHDINDRYYMDPLKIIIHSRYTNITGFDLQKQLEEKGIYTELSDLFNTLSIITFGTNKKDVERLTNVLKQLDNQLQQKIKRDVDQPMGETLLQDYGLIFHEKESIISLKEVLYGKKKTVFLEEAIGEIAAEMVIPYPPGIPIIQLGEKITKDDITFIMKLRENGARFQGVENPSLATIKVVDLRNKR